MTYLNNSLNILFVYDCIYPESLGGVEHRNYQLARVLSEKGHQITMAGWTKKSKHPLPDVKIIPLPFRQSLYNQEGKRTALTSLLFSLAVIALPIQRFDLIVTDNIPYLHLFSLVFLCCLRQKPLLITWHEYWGKYWQKYLPNKTWRLFWGCEYLTAQLGKKVIAVSEFTARRLAQKRFNSNAIEVVYNGVDLHLIVQSTRNIQRNAPPLIYAGRLMKEKRIDLLLNAIAKLSPHTEGVMLQIIGDGPERDNLVKLADELAIREKIRFLGRLPSIEEVWQQLAKAKIAVQPSEREGFGMFPLEAMAVGTPVIYCQSPESAVSEIVRDGVEGIAVNADSQSLADAINFLWSDESQWLKLSHNAQLRAKSFDWQTIAPKLAKIAYQLV